MGGAKAKNAPPLSIQDKRLKILQRVKKEARTLGGALDEEKAMKKGSLSPPGKRRGHSKSPQRTRSVSPMTTGNSGEKGKKNSKKVKFSVPISGKHDKAQEVSFVSVSEAISMISLPALSLSLSLCCRVLLLH